MADFKVTELDADFDFGSVEYWDVVIIGAGPAGLAASLTTAHRGLTTLVIEAKETFERLGVKLNDDGSIAVDPYFETSRRGIFAVGDVHGDIKLIAVAWAEGIQAAIYAFKEITSPYWLNEKRLQDQKIALIGEKLHDAAGQTWKSGK